MTRHRALRIDLKGRCYLRLLLDSLRCSQEELEETLYVLHQIPIDSHSQAFDVMLSCENNTASTVAVSPLPAGWMSWAYLRVSGISSGQDKVKDDLVLGVDIAIQEFQYPSFELEQTNERR